MEDEVEQGEIPLAQGDDHSPGCHPKPSWVLKLPLAIVRGILLCAPLVLFFTVCLVATAAFFLVPCYVSAVHSLARTQVLTRSQQVFVGLSLVVPFVLWLPLVTACSLLGGLVLVVFWYPLLHGLEPLSTAIPESTTTETDDEGTEIDASMRSSFTSGLLWGVAPGRVSRGARTQERDLPEQQQARQLFSFEASVVHEGWALVVDFYNFHRHTVPGYLRQLRLGSTETESDSEDSDDDNVLIFNPWVIVLVSYCGILAGVVAAMGVFVLCAPKFIPTIFRLWTTPCQSPQPIGFPSPAYLVLIPVMMVYLVLIPFVVAAIAIVMVFGSFFYAGTSAVLTMLRTGSLLDGVEESFQVVADFDMCSAEALRMWPIFTCCMGGPWMARGEQGERARLNASMSDGPPISIESWNLMNMAWDHYLEVCQAEGISLLSQGVYTKETFTWQEPGMFVGLPGVALLTCLYQSIDKGVEGILIGEGLEITEANRPSISLIDLIWTPLQAIRLELIGKNLAPMERDYLRQFVAMGGGVASYWRNESGGQSKALPDLKDEVRRVELHRLASQIYDVAINITRLPMFRRRFGEVIASVLEEQDRAQPKIERREGEGSGVQAQFYFNMEP